MTLNMYVALLYLRKLLEPALNRLDDTMHAIYADGLWYCDVNLQNLLITATRVSYQPVNLLDENRTRKLVEQHHHVLVEHGLCERMACELLHLSNRESSMGQKEVDAD